MDALLDIGFLSALGQVFHQAFSEPRVLAGLLTLIGLEIVLGVDNLIFIAILTESLPPAQRDRARIVGLSLALFMRLALLAGIAWMVGLTQEIFAIGPISLSWRDIILIGGGCFLLFKATTEIHERIEGVSHTKKRLVRASFFAVIAQILVLDAVFSLDSIITAVGIVRELWVMMTAVVVAMIVMIVGSGPLTRFVGRHPTVIMLCLSFLLMIGLSLITEGLGADIPKGYLYGAMAFSILVEFFNQVRERNIRKHAEKVPLRERAADTVIRLLGGRTVSEGGVLADPTPAPGEEPLPFGETEREMVAGVLRLGGRTVRSIMTPRGEIAWLDIAADNEAIRSVVARHGHARYLVCDGRLEEVRGVVLVRDLFGDLVAGGQIDLKARMHPPLVVPETLPVTSLIETLKTTPTRLAIISDDFGDIHGIVTPTDVLAEISRDLVEDEDAVARPERLANGSLRFRGAMPIDEVASILERRDMVGAGRYSTLAGFVLWHIGSVPAQGHAFDWQGYHFVCSKVEGNRIQTIDITGSPDRGRPA
ncbi:CBS domain-containing protein [Phaeovibrio sulfidiphilus]|uniref:CBS domain-containing protein n=1 Tax=Phaeovibrio sulfidiphilus TaxID=1220600 RepID=A0A8J6YL66_9PROT|nr:transporter associated domain-containing protein [Phaeovibrio sulfidiphilus]MBE1236568.1 CBS domain-containing protein [Phaeovibrio sulfidiphilus]